MWRSRSALGDGYGYVKALMTKPEKR